MYRYYSIPRTVIRLLSSSQKSNRFLAIIIYLKECALIHISMSIIEKVFKYEETELSVIMCIDDIWFRGKTIAKILGYGIQCKAIRDHVDPEDKRKLSELGPKSKQNETDPLKSRGSKTDPLTNNEKNTIYINESGLYSLILRSRLESARAFKRWVTKDVLPSIRKTGRYIYDDMNHKYGASLMQV